MVDVNMFTILSRPQLVRRLMSLAHAPLTQSGLIAAAVATLFRDPGVHHVLPCFCEEIIVHWPSFTSWHSHRVSAFSGAGVVDSVEGCSIIAAPPPTILV